MILYHYTSLAHLQAIKASGIIKTTESNIGSPNPRLKPFGMGYGPDVVWLTEQSEVTTGHGLNGSLVNKFEVRLAVNVPDAMRWSEFAKRHGINTKWYRILNKSGGNTAKYWWVVPRPISVNTEVKEILIKE